MKPMAWLLLPLIIVVMPISLAMAVSPDSPTLIEQSALDRHAHAIAEQLRCLVCQGETVADSHSGLAADMRAVIHDKLAQGWTDRRIMGYFVQRYGDFVLYRPPVESSTWALWFGPLIMLLIALAVLLGHVRRRARREPRAALTPADARRARYLLDMDEEDPP